MIVAPIPTGARLIDSVGLEPQHIAGLTTVDGIIAYLGGNLTAELVAEAHAHGKGVVPVNFSRGDGWLPTADMGHADASTTLERLDKLGLLLPGLVDWCDLEGAGADPTGYLDAWAGDVFAKLVAGLYVGAGALLTAAQLYALPHFTRYWHSLSRGIPEPQCGFVLAQLYPSTTLNGLGVDYDFAQQDFRGRAATWVLAA